MTWYALDTWIVVVGSLCAVSCAVLGVFLVLRQMSMMGDAISHGVLPGLAIAFFVTESRASLTMFAGAAVAGALTAVFTQWISRWGHVDRGASMGIVFTSLFALGLVLMTRAADRVDLDPGCVLYGAIEMTPLDVAVTVSLAGKTLEIPRAALTSGAMALINLIFIGVFFKELRITSFDPALATTLGFRAEMMHYALMMLVAMTTVAAFEAAGSILVIAMLIVPAATAHLLTDRLGSMIAISVLVALASAFLGHLGAMVTPGWFGYSGTSTAGMMTVAMGILFFAAMVFSPRHGILRQWKSRRRNPA